MEGGVLVDSARKGEGEVVGAFLASAGAFEAKDPCTSTPPPPPPRTTDI